MILYRKLAWQEVERRLFDGFVRHQVVDLCLRRGETGWVVQPDPFDCQLEYSLNRQRRPSAMARKNSTCLSS